MILVSHVRLQDRTRPRRVDAFQSKTSANFLLRLPGMTMTEVKSVALPSCLPGVSNFSL
jgi:hypothetical protein